ncbi:TetR/AcrR family transcriptional regulator [Nguyenibacter vanlangensis]|uniref:TetR/AcrR family transcriptional regulator n=1 Tax=Nguyenibacter vanlangensis TaxID=1216886 RepID=A0ABZ3D9E5_9PROT
MASKNIREEKPCGEKRGRGRPQSFDRSKALCAAMRLFWDRGYEGARFDDLIAAMGISPSSFYNAFGSKERLYQEAIDAYLEAAGTWFLRILHENADTRTAFEKLMLAAAMEFTREDLPAGCMISVSGTQGGPEQARLRDLMARQRALSEAALVERLRKGIADADLPAHTDAEGLAAFFSALFRGMAVQARDGASREKLLEIGRIGMLAWPADPFAVPAAGFQNPASPMNPASPLNTETDFR